MGCDICIACNSRFLKSSVSIITSASRSFNRQFLNISTFLFSSLDGIVSFLYIPVPLKNDMTRAGHVPAFTSRFVNG